MMEQVLDVPSQEVITKDNVMVKVDGIVFFQVMDAAAGGLSRSPTSTIAIINLTMTNLRTVMGSMDLDELLSQRDEINHRLLHGGRRRHRTLGRQGDPHRDQGHRAAADITNVMARQMKAERDKRAVILEAEGERQAAILTAEGEKQAAILAGRGPRGGRLPRRRGARALGRGRGQGHASGVRGHRQGQRPGDQLFRRPEYIGGAEGAAPRPNQKTLILPIEASSVIGAIAGVAEIAREAFGGGGDASASATPKPQAPARPRAGGSVPTV